MSDVANGMLLEVDGIDHEQLVRRVAFPVPGEGIRPAYETICAEVTAGAVKAHFGSMVTGHVERYEADNVLALNFVMHGALGGGGPRSLRADSLGKTLGGALVRMEIEVPDELAGRRRARPDVGWADDILRS